MIRSLFKSPLRWIQRYSTDNGFNSINNNPPLGLDGRPLSSWTEYHNQFAHTPPRPQIDTDDRDIGLYPRLDPQLDYQSRDYRHPWQDKTEMRNYGEPMAEESDRLNGWSVERPSMSIWRMLGGIGLFIGGFLSIFKGLEWADNQYGPVIKYRPFDLIKPNKSAPSMNTE